MIGTDLNLTLPEAGQTIATNTARTATCLAALEAAVADKATPAVININAPLEMNGNAITEVSSAVFVSGNLSSTPGSLFYFGGDWYAVDSVGAIQLTDNGAINAAGIGGIVGDYGGVNPAKVSFDDASGEYRFTEDTGVYADLVADDLVLNGSAGSVRFQVDAAITTARTFNVKSLPTSGCSFLVYDSSDNSLKDGATVNVTNNLVSTANITATEFKHGDKTFSKAFGVGAGAIVGALSFGEWFAGPPAGYRWQATSNAVVITPIFNLRTGWRVKKIKVQGSSSLGSAIVYTVQRYDSSTALTATVTGGFNTTGYMDATLDTPYVVQDGDTIYVRISTGSATTDFAEVRVTYDIP